MSNRNLFTSESVTEGHPDKVCDQISDAIVDALIDQDPRARVAVETMITPQRIHLGGEVASTATVDYAQIALDVVRRIGYTSLETGFDADTAEVLVAIGQQSVDIARGVDQASIDDQGAGDQGMMFGYACNETRHLMPAPIALAHEMARSLAQVRRTMPALGLRPDGKTQVTVEYDGDRPVRVTDVVISSQHEPDVDSDTLNDALSQFVALPAIRAAGLEGYPRIMINPTGRFVVGGPAGDAGLTGRKVIVDTYGGMARHGGGAFSGKDPSKVDRSAAYAARWVAKNVVAAGLADRCEIQVAYAIGCPEPVSVRVETFGTEHESVEHIRQAILATFDLRPGHIILDLGLLRPIYSATAAYGHMGRPAVDFAQPDCWSPFFPWERTDRAERLVRALEDRLVPSAIA